MLTRDEYRKIKGFSREEMSKWITYHNQLMGAQLQKQYEAAYKDEIDSSVQNFIAAIGYTLHYNEDINLDPDKMASFMEDLFETVDMFRRGEAKPDDYTEQLKEDGIVLTKYDYDKLYRQNEQTVREGVEKVLLPYKERNDKAIKWVEDFQAHGPTSCNLGDLTTLENILKGDL